MLGAIALWLSISVWVAWRLAKLVERSELRWLCFFIAAPLLIAAPLADEIIGKYQFERYCENAKELKIFGTIPVGEELYTPDGKWRLSLGQIPPEEFKRLRSVVESLIKWDLGPRIPKEVPGAIPINEYHDRVYDKRTGRILAEFRSYSNRGGWLRRSSGLGGGTGGFFIRQSCAPEPVRTGSITQQLLRYEGKGISK